MTAPDSDDRASAVRAMAASLFISVLSTLVLYGVSSSAIVRSGANRLAEATVSSMMFLSLVMSPLLVAVAALTSACFVKISLDALATRISVDLALRITFGAEAARNVSSLVAFLVHPPRPDTLSDPSSVATLLKTQLTFDHCIWGGTLVLLLCYVGRVPWRTSIVCAGIVFVVRASWELLRLVAATL